MGQKGELQAPGLLTERAGTVSKAPVITYTRKKNEVYVQTV